MFFLGEPYLLSVSLERNREDSDSSDSLKQKELLSITAPESSAHLPSAVHSESAESGVFPSEERIQTFSPNGPDCHELAQVHKSVTILHPRILAEDL